MKEFLGFAALVIFGSVIMIVAVVEHDPPAVVAYAFGIITGFCWAGLIVLHWLRSEDEGDDKDD